jgi:exopolysaccharide production protein ExoQ
MVLVVLSDPNPAAAMKRLLARVGFLLVPLSVLLIKYYPALGRTYNRWTWEAYFTGVSTDKNGLGGVCVIVGLASLWHIIDGWHHRRSWPPLVAHGLVLAMALWLFTQADSSTALACFLLGVLLIVTTARVGGMHPAYVHVIVGAIAMLVVFGVLLPNGYTYVVQALGRNTTLTGRTEIWGDLMTMDVNQWVGTGFESFWLGPRAEYLADKYYFHPNQAHNGYIEMYVNLGWIGVGFLVLLMAAGYRRIVEAYGRNASISTLRLALLATAAVYNVTEATFKVMHPMWIVFLLAIAFRAAPEGDDGNEATI